MSLYRSKPRLFAMRSSPSLLNMKVWMGPQWCIAAKRADSTEATCSTWFSWQLSTCPGAVSTCITYTEQIPILSGATASQACSMYWSNLPHLVQLTAFNEPWRCLLNLMTCTRLSSYAQWLLQHKRRVQRILKQPAPLKPFGICP